MNILTKHLDLFAGLGALAWAVTGLFVEPLNALVDYRAASAFGVLALSRWYTGLKAIGQEEANP